MRKIEILDTTLRDGAQGTGISYSVKDKLQIVEILDNFGIDFIEAGNASSNVKDVEFFRQVKKLQLKKTKIVSFGSTKRHNVPTQKDTNLKALLDTEIEHLSIFGKCSFFHIKNILKISLEDNLQLIAETIEYLVSKGRKVFFDAEHYFDAFKFDREYALLTLKTAVIAGAERIILCDTNGGTFPDDIAEIVEFTAKNINVPLGIHTHNDVDCATANTLAAVRKGATQIQGTFTGVGERCGNANLSSIIPTLQLKYGYNCIPHIKNITSVARKISEISNITLPENSPYVGKCAFAHKAGMHINGVVKNANSFEHISPDFVGNERNFRLSEISGRSAIIEKLKETAPEIINDDIIVKQISETLKNQEFKGYSYEAAESSFALIVLKYLGKLKDFFTVEYYRIDSGKNCYNNSLNIATVKINVNEETKITAAEGKGPVGAIDNALRQGLAFFYPQIENMKLVDYKVRILDSISGTEAITRVLIESSDGINSWGTVGVSDDIIEASVEALTDSIIYFLQKISKE